MNPFRWEERHQQLWPVIYHTYPEVNLLLAVPLNSIDIATEPVTRLVPRQLDRVLGQLLIPGQVSLIHGPDRSPLTTIAHAVAVGAVKSGGRSAYLDSGSNYSSALARVLCNRSGSPEDLLKEISVGPVMSLADLEGMVLQVSSIEGITMVVVDSLTGVLNLTGAPRSKGRQRKLFATLEVLRGVVNDNNIHLFITDHSTRNWNSGTPSPIGGNVIAHGVDSIIRVDRLAVKEGMFRLEVERSPVNPADKGVIVQIGLNGIRSIK